MTKITLIFFLMLLFFLSFSQHFQNVNNEQNINVISIISEFNGGWGNGVSFYDFDNDGWDDLTIAIENDTIAFYKNNFGVFERIPAFIFIDGRVKQVLWVDYDNDGHNDLFITQYGAPYKLYRNNGDFNFTDVSIQAGLPQLNLNTWGAAFGDYDRDGYLDLYVAMYETDAQTPENPLRTNQLFRNNGDGTFTNVTSLAGVSNGLKLSFLGAWIDYDRDGWPDLYVINDRTPFNNSLYRNNRDGTFTDVAPNIGADVIGQDPMTISVADFDNDGDYDIFMTNSGGGTKFGNLLINNSNQSFTESAAQYGVNINLNSWGALWLDYNNNSYKDLFISIDEQFFMQPQESNLFFINNDGQNFTLSNNIIPENDRARGYAVAMGDFNNDGYCDFINHNRDNLPFLYQNSGGENHYIKITPNGVYSNTMAIGAEIMVYCENNQYIHYVMNSENFLGQNSQHIIFGLKSFELVDSVKIIYPSGYEDIYYNLPVDTHFIFTEGETYKINVAISESINNCIGDSILLSAPSDFENYLWNDNYGNTQSITVYESGKYIVRAEKNGFIYTSDSIEVNFINPPIINIQNQNPICFNFSDGFIDYDIETMADSFSISWEINNLEIEILENLSEGTYLYTYNDSYNCSITDSVILSSPQAINIQYQLVENENYSLQFVVNGGVQPYNIYLNNLQIFENIAQLDNDNLYILKVIDSNNCLDSVIINLSTDTFTTDLIIVNENLSQNILFPNPCNNSISLYTKKDIIEWSIISLDGRFINISQDKIADVSFLKSGVYFAYLKFDNGEIDIIKFIKK